MAYRTSQVCSAALLKSEAGLDLTPEQVREQLTRMRSASPRRIARSADRYSVVRVAGMASVCHVSPITGRWAAGQKVYEQFFRYAREKPDVQFCTLREVVADHG